MSLSESSALSSSRQPTFQTRYIVCSAAQHRHSLLVSSVHFLSHKYIYVHIYLGIYVFMYIRTVYLNNPCLRSTLMSRNQSHEFSELGRSFQPRGNRELNWSTQWWICSMFDESMVVVLWRVGLCTFYETYYRGVHDNQGYSSTILWCDDWMDRMYLFNHLWWSVQVNIIHLGIVVDVWTLMDDHSWRIPQHQSYSYICGCYCPYNITVTFITYQLLFSFYRPVAHRKFLSFRPKTKLFVAI